MAFLFVGTLPPDKQPNQYPFSTNQSEPICSNPINYKNEQLTMHNNRNQLVQTLKMVSLMALACMASSTFAETVGIKQLAWMTGSWEGPIGPNTLEENWSRPLDGSISALVRSRGEGKTSMIELIVIEEENDSIVLRLQQWNPGFTPRTPGPQVMALDSIGENRVAFKSTGEGGLKTLAYSRPSDRVFNIDIETAEGAKFQINLSAFNL
jgi:hypothetical protein